MPSNKTEAALDKKGLAWISILGCLVMFTFVWHFKKQVRLGMNDFIQLYASATLLPEHKIYSVDDTIAIQKKEIGIFLRGVYFSRPAFYSVLLRPFARLPYLSAYYLYQALSAVCLLLTLYTWQKRSPYLVALACWSFPVAMTIIQGQDLFYVLLIVTLSMLSIERKWDFAAGLLFSLCAIKAHLFVIVPIAALLYKRWRFLLGGACGGGSLFILGVAADGPRWLEHYVGMLKVGDLHLGQARMPNIRGFFENIDFYNPVIESSVYFCVLLLTILAMKKVGEFESAIAIAFVGGLLMSYHAYPQDGVILLIAFALISSRTQSSISSWGLAISTFPAFYLLLFFEPYGAALPIYLVCFLVVISFGAGKHSQDAVVLNQEFIGGADHCI